MAKKEVDKDRYYFNPKTGDKVYSHYTDKTEIVLSAEEKKKAEDAKQACINQALKFIEEDPSAKEKPAYKRMGLKKKPKDKKEEEKK